MIEILKAVIISFFIVSDYQNVLDIIFGRWRSQITYAGVKLGVFDIIESKMSASEIAEKLKINSTLSYRLLRALGSIGLLEEDKQKNFCITPMGKFLRKDNPQSLRAVTLLEEGPEHYAIWKHLPEMIKDGKQDGFVREFGMQLFDYIPQNPEYSEVFNQAMSSYSGAHTQWVLEALEDYDFTQFSHLCDIGGGHGHLICNLLQKYPNLKGAVLELENTIKDKDLLWANKMGLSDRCAYLAGDMFAKVPRADAYMMKMILHDWSDEECVQILSNISKSAQSGARLFVVEHIVPESHIPHFSKLFDIHMLCGLTGRERTVKEFSELFEKAGLKFVKTHYPPSQMIGVVEAVKP